MRFFISIILVSCFLGCGAPQSPVQNTPTTKDWSIPSFEAGYADEPVFKARVFYQVGGPEDAPGVVLVHGLGNEASRHWESLAQTLSKEYRVLLFDLPGFGLSSKANTVYSPKKYAEFMAEFIPKFIPKPFHLVGHSMGGAIALAYAGTYPNDVNRLVVADVAGVLHRQAYTKNLVHLGIDSVFDKSGSVLETPKRLTRWLADTASGALLNDPISPEKILASPEARQHFLSGDPTRIASLGLILENLGPSISNITAPTGIIWGQKDDVAPMRTALLLKDRIEPVTFTLIDNADHVPMVSAPQIFNKLVEDHLSTTAPSPRFPGLAAITASERVGRCREKSGVVFEGIYQKIEIDSCTHVELKNVQAGSLIIKNSTVNLEGSTIRSQNRAIDATHSTITMTGGAIEGKTAIVTRDSAFDIAGTKLAGTSSVIETRSPSRVLLSVCPAKGKNTTKYLHGLYTLKPKETLW